MLNAARSVVRKRCSDSSVEYIASSFSGMGDSPMSHYVVPPHINTYPIPNEEREFVSRLNTSLDFIRTHVGHFAAAVSLMDYCMEHADRYHAWAPIAARDGGIQLFNFGEAMKAVHLLLPKIAVVKDIVDAAEVKKARDFFQGKFPKNEDIRNAISHAGEQRKLKDPMRVHAFKKKKEVAPGGTFDGRQGKNMFGTSLQDRQFTTNWNAKIVSYELSAESLANVGQSLEMFWAPFRVAEATSQRMAEDLRKQGK